MIITALAISSLAAVPMVSADDSQGISSNVVTLEESLSNYNTDGNITQEMQTCYKAKCVLHGLTINNS